MQIDMEKIRRGQVRWTLLLALQNARPYGAHEGILLPTVQGLYPDATPLEIRRELDYLEERKLVEVEKSPQGAWKGSLTRHGVDFVEYTIDAEPGIARPEKYW